ncbi:hypothetical protein COL65_20280 [Priestia aryabhattai]|uniref:hypothetical protein n=1 Tax=Priestia aryabhattai TaxID=412384 RepID=UPI000BF6A0F6|nr:hypothetical protein [Priestia aryabhattai]PGA16231.1 hypothetical protein COL65_20280 [Priestia aryabhattai]
MENYFNITHSEISDLHHLLNSVTEGTATLDLNEFSTKCKNYLRFLNKVYKEWFPRSKPYTDFYITDCLFTYELETKTWVNINLISLIKSVKRTQDIILKNSINNQTVPNGELLFFKEVVFDSIEFLNLGYECMTGIKSENGTHRRRNIKSHEIFNTSKRFLRKEFYVDDIVTMPSSIFFIRQAIEIRLKNAFGIVSIRDKDGKFKKITGENFLNLVDENSPDIEFPIKKSIVRKIHSWTNYYIHGGSINYSWHIEWAHYMLQPLFNSGEVENVGWHISGSIKMKKSYYNDIENRIKGLFNNEEGLQIIRMNYPEAIIIEN